MNFKIPIIGDSFVGKTSIILRYVKNIFKHKNDITIGVDFFSHNISFENNLIKFELWDTAGQERFNSLIPMYLRQSDAILLTFDLTNLHSFNQIRQKWMPYINNYIVNLEKIPICLVGNKSDLSNQINVFDDDINKFIEEENLNIKYYKVSAKEGSNISNIFNDIAESLYYIHKDDDKEIEKPIEKIDKKKCCTIL